MPPDGYHLQHIIISALLKAQIVLSKEKTQLSTHILVAVIILYKPTAVKVYKEPEIPESS